MVKLEDYATPKELAELVKLGQLANQLAAVVDQEMKYLYIQKCYGEEGCEEFKEAFSNLLKLRKSWEEAREESYEKSKVISDRWMK